MNNSWSGSRVTKLPDSKTLFPSASSDERTSGLHINSVMPDVILVFLGFNDWAQGVPLLQEAVDTGESARELEACFASAYDRMIVKLKQNYPEAEIWCCTLNTTSVFNNSNFVFPYEYAGMNIQKYNKVIREIAKQRKCKIIDFARFNRAYDSIDGTHPNGNGMFTLAKMAIKEIGGKEVEEFIGASGDDLKTVNLIFKDSGLTLTFQKSYIDNLSES